MLPIYSISSERYFTEAKIIYTYTQFSSLAIVMVYTVAAYTEIAITKPLLPGFLQASGHIFLNQLMHKLIVCVFLLRHLI